MKPRQRKPSKKPPLMEELRRKPFRPILVEDLRTLEPDLKEPTPIHISKAAYEELYQNAFAFTETDSGLFLTMFEVGFHLEGGSVRTHRPFRAYQRIVKKLLEMGAAEIFTKACRTWESKAKGLDLNDERIMTDYGWFELLEPAVMLEYELMEEERDLLGVAGLLAFEYNSGFAACMQTPVVGEPHLHTHTVSHMSASAYFPSTFDDSSPAIWAIVDVEFIKQTLTDETLPHKAKIKAILDHHVEGMAEAVCVGVQRTEGEFIPLIRSKKRD